MPEGHLVHRIAEDHAATLAGRAVRVSSPQGRFATEAADLDGRVLEDVDAHGKHLFYRWDGGRVVHVHLGMQGKVLAGPPDGRTVAQARLRIEGEGSVTHLVAPAVCELLAPGGEERIVGRLGPDPLRHDADALRVVAALTSSPRPVGALLLDQAVVSGVGNVLRAECLFAAGVHPARKGAALEADEAWRLWWELVEVMRRSKVEGRITTVRPEGRNPVDVPESEGRYVYRQQQCRRCGTPVEAWQLAGRTAYACPQDQPRQPDREALEQPAAASRPPGSRP